MMTEKPVEAVTDKAPRCWHCRKLLADLLTRPWKITCPRCKETNEPSAQIERR